MNWFRIVTTFFLVLSLATLQAIPTSAEEVIFVGRVQIAGTATDLSGQSDPQENGTPQNRLGGIGSGIAWTGHGNRYVMLPDRGPDDGANSYRCRVQIVQIDVVPGAAEPVGFRLLETHMLTSANGENFVGRASVFDREHPEKSLRLDPEGIRVTDRHTWLISDEYGPIVREFDISGKWLRDFETPPKFAIASPGATPAEELPPINTSGRQTNRGWEGIALSLDGRKILTITQGPLIQDGGLDEKNARVGTNLRLWERDLKSGKTQEFLYALDDKSYGCSEIEAIGPNRFLVIERDGLPGETAKAKLIYEIDLSNATDISAIERLPSEEIPNGVRPVAKKLFLDLLAERHGLPREMFPEKIEGIAFGPRFPD